VAVMLVGLVLVPVVAGRWLGSVRTGLFRTESVQYRLEEWNTAMRMVRGRPVLGWGPDTYFGNYGRYRSARDAVQRELTIPDKPHNVFLEWGTSTGIVGLLIYLVL